MNALVEGDRATPVLLQLCPRLVQHLVHLQVPDAGQVTLLLPLRSTTLPVEKIGILL